MDAQLLTADLLSRLDDACRAAGWRVRRQVEVPSSLPGRPDRQCVAPDGTRWLVALRAAAGRARENVLRDRLAAAILEARAFATEAEHRGRQGRWLGLALVGAPKLTEKMCDRLATYARAFGGDLPWGAVDLRGVRRLEGQGLAKLATSARERSDKPPPMESAPLPSPFTDLGQWLLKVLLGDRLPQGWIRLPDRAEVDEANRVTRLALRADVSPGTVSRFASALQGDGFAELSGREIVPVRVRSLCESWFHVVAAQPVMERRTRFLFGGSDDAHERMARVLREHAGRPDGTGHRVDAALGMFSAARELGVGFVTGAPVHVMARDISDSLLGLLGLTPVDGSAPADVVVRCPSFPESTFRAAAEAPSGVRVTDAIQCWLDLRSHPARGQELADELWERMGLEVAP
jgi:hypothetical protein